MRFTAILRKSQFNWPGETEASCDAAHSGAHQVVQVPIGGRGQFQRAETDIVECLVIQEEALIRILDELVKTEDRIIWLHHRVGDLRTWNDREGFHDAVWVLFPNLGDEQGAHSRSRASAQGVAHLEALEAIATL